MSTPAGAAEEQLIRSAQRGDPRSFNSLVESYQVQVYSFIARYVSDRQLAEDVAQETFLAAWRGIGSFKGGSFRAWLFRIAVNEARDMYRKSSRRPATSLDQMLESGVSIAAEADSAPGPEQQALAKLSLHRLEAAVERLSPEHRELVLLSDVHELTYDEISAATGLPLGTIKSRLFRARSTLRRLLLAEGEL